MQESEKQQEATQETGIPQEVMEQVSRIPHFVKTIELLEGEVSMHRADKASLLVQLEHASYETQELKKLVSDNQASEPQPTE